MPPAPSSLIPRWWRGDANAEWGCCCCCGNAAQQQPQQQQQQQYGNCWLLSTLFTCASTCCSWRAVGVLLLLVLLAACCCSSAAAARAPRSSTATAAAGANLAAACCSPIVARTAFLLGASQLTPVLPPPFSSSSSSSSSSSKGFLSVSRCFLPLQKSSLPSGALLPPAAARTDSSGSSVSSSSKVSTGSSSSSGSGSLTSAARRLLWQLHVAAVASVSLTVWEAALLVNEGLSVAWGWCLSAAAAAAGAAAAATAAAPSLNSSCCFQSLTASCERARAAVQQQLVLLPQRRAARASAISQLWARVTLTLGGLRPRVFGAANAEVLGGPQGAPCLVVSNHCGLIDIPITGGFLPLRHIRYISKHEVFSWPVVGRAMREIGVVGFERNCVSGTLRLIRELSRVMLQHKTAAAAGEAGKGGPFGAPVFLGFPEGSRARDGRIKPPKLGLFQIAQRLGLMVLPVSIVGAQQVQPAGRLLPIPSASGLEMHIHPVVNICGRPVEEAAAEVWNAVIKGLPPEQQPLAPLEFETTATAAAAAAEAAAAPAATAAT
ncbi:hypothetical protein Esti_001626 [Eimeria stiedai]